MYLRDVAAAIGTSGYEAGDPEAVDYDPRAMKAVWSLFVFATVFILLRLYSKARRNNALWWDDYVLLASWIFFLVACAQLSINVRNGFGRSGSTLDPDSLDRVGLDGLVVGTGLLLATPGSKTSFVITLGRISGPKLTAALWCATVSMNAFHAANLVVQWAQCTPLEKSWDLVVEGSCLPIGVNLGLSMGSAGTCFFLNHGRPWLCTKKVGEQRMPGIDKEKIGVCLAMSMGVLAAATAFAKVPKLQVLASTDFTLDGVDLVILASTEIAQTMVAASVPMLRTLVCDITASHAKRQTEKSSFRARVLDTLRRVRGSRSSRNGIAAAIETVTAFYGRHAQPNPVELHLSLQHDPAPSHKPVSYGPQSRRGSGDIVVEMREFGASDGDRRDDSSSETL
ncbi:hypothetical protein RB598_007775 [Gaeumannomyces tritici]